MRKDLPQRLLRELFKNSKRSDRELAKILKVSQPTITRTRHKLEESRMIEDYTIIPDFQKMGFEIMAITFVKIRPQSLSPETVERARAHTERRFHTIFASAGEGLGMNGVSIAFFRNYTEYQRQLNHFRAEWTDVADDIRSFVVTLGEDEFKRFSLKYLGDTSL